MTDKNQDSGPAPEPHDETASFSVNGSGEAAAAPRAAEDSGQLETPPPVVEAFPPVVENPVLPVDAQPVEAAPAVYPTAPAVYPSPPAGPAASASDATSTAAYPTDAFGRPVTGTPTQDYATADGNQTAPVGPTLAKDSAKRRSSIGLIAALAIAALVGGASGAGIYALADSNQSSSVPSNQSQGASNVVVNNTDSVNEITAVAAKASPSVVTIEVTSGQDGGTGSGVILSEDGYVLTNTHVVTLDGAVGDAAIQVKANDGTLYAATVVGTDPVSDLAVIKLTDASGLTPIQWADSSKLNVGDTAIAIGSPLGLAGTVTNGIVSALNRSITVASSAAPSTPDQTMPDQGEGANPFDFWNFDIPNQDGTQQAAPQATGSISLPVIQTDAAINPGNSGGALLNSKGELIGINVAIANAGGSGAASAAGSIGVGFSIPSNFAERISQEIIADGKASHGLLGASVQSAASDSASTTVGALIMEISSGGAAEKAGLRAGDIVTNFNGVPITDPNDLTAQVRVLPAGGTADLTYVRDGQSTTVSVTVGELSS
ncbi:S1C family serine protease [Cryobacterium roopkundense]|uniref:Putative serine protease PepD n=1 Tax=Cryobacterium roopkundense TaxID=1001240 RepID=A0A7W8ZXL1_9MICO|nr:trypsin-like peptidase domain-containing protein [Cryobacterium roopkundense]MBB5641837.1 putative serine protease PepD [Cryobacterium roopkundense]